MRKQVCNVSRNGEEGRKVTCGQKSPVSNNITFLHKSEGCEVGPAPISYQPALTPILILASPVIMGALGPSRLTRGWLHPRARKRTVPGRLLLGEAGERHSRRGSRVPSAHRARRCFRALACLCCCSDLDRHLLGNGGGEGGRSQDHNAAILKRTSETPLGKLAAVLSHLRA